MINVASILKSRDITLPTKVCLVKAMVFLVVMYGVWELDNKEGWKPNNWCFWTMVLEKTLESPLDCKGIQPVNPKGNQSWMFIERTDAEAETPMLWPLNVKNWFIRKDPDDGKDWRQKEKGTVEDEMDCWIWANCGRRWRTGNPGVLQAMGSQRVSNLKTTRTALTLRRCLINNCWTDV